jgi:flagellar L-ring protein precursor FlgH
MKSNKPILWWNVASNHQPRPRRSGLDRSLAVCTILFIGVVFMLLGGCATAPKVEMPEVTTARPVVAPKPVAANGAIFQVASYRPLFEDRRARHVGDILIVQIAEKISASKKASTTTDRTSSMDAGISALPFVSPNSFARASAKASSDSAFEGKGATANDNTFSGTITVTVVEVLPNGNLLVAGEKQVGVNQNMDVLRFSGVVDPATILAGNTVSSYQIADARIAFRGKGGIDEAQTVGWLARFFLSFLPF